MTGDGVVFPLWYFKYAEKMRPDITLAGTAVLPMKWVRSGIARQNPGIAVPALRRGQKAGTESTVPMANFMLRKNYGRFPVYFTYNRPEQGAMNGGFFLVPEGIIYRVHQGAFTPGSRYLSSLYAAWETAPLFRAISSSASLWTSTRHFIPNSSLNESNSVSLSGLRMATISSRASAP